MPATRSSSGRRTKIRSMSSSIVAVSSASDSALGSSGLKAGSVESEARALCSSAVTWPSFPSSESKPSGSELICSSAISQPPVAFAKKRWATPSVAANERPSYSYHPSRGAMLAYSWSVRNCSSSSSGLIPGSSLRNTLSTVSSPNTIEELDCSTPIGRTGASGTSCPESWARWKPKHPFSVSIDASAAIARSRPRARSGSAKASNTSASSVRWIGTGWLSPSASGASMSSGSW